MRAAREAIGADAELFVDANGAYSRKQALAFAEEFAALGATWFEEPGLVHGYLRARHTAGRARASFSRIVEAVSVLGKGGWAW